MNRKLVAFSTSLIVISVLVIGTVFESHAFEASPDTWVTKASMHEARFQLRVAAANGKLYAIGGFFGVPGQFSRTNEEYDPITDSWTTKTPAPTPLGCFGIAVFRNKIYCIGGVTATNFSSPIGYTVTAANQVYDPATNTWETKASMPNPDWMIQAHVLGDKIYVIGGTTNENRVYDPATDTWSTKAPMLYVPRDYSMWSGTSIVMDEKIYAFHSGFQPRLQIYDPKTDNWTLGTEITTPFAAVASATTGTLAPKRIYLFACDALHWGLVLPGFITQVFDPLTNTWSRGAPMSIGRVYVGVANINDTFYVIGGGTPYIGGGIDESVANEQYVPVGYGTITPPSPTNSSTFTVSLSESVSALNFGDRINFTVTTNGGSSPYFYSWFIDNQLVQNSSSSAFSLNSSAVGSHHVFVQVSDANNNTAQTLTVAFEVLPQPSQSSSPTPASASPSPSIPEFPTGTAIVILTATVVSLLVSKRFIFTSRKGSISYYGT